MNGINNLTRHKKLLQYLKEKRDIIFLQEMQLVKLLVKTDKCKGKLGVVGKSDLVIVSFMNVYNPSEEGPGLIKKCNMVQ